MNIHKRLKEAKLYQLCYRCLSFGHLGQTCSRVQIYGIDGCREMHNRMLHGKQISVQKSADEKKTSTGTAGIVLNNPTESSSLSSKNTKKKQSGNSTEQQESITCKEKEQKEDRSHTTVTNQDDLGLMEEFISLRTVPVMIAMAK